MKTEIIYVQLRDEDIQIVNNYLLYVDEEKQNRLKQYHSYRGRALSLFADLIIRQRICKVYDIPNKDIIFAKNQFGKPYLKNYNDFYFNISHSQDVIVVSFSNSEIGVDIERIKESDIRIAKRLFSQNEQLYIMSADNSSEAFYEIWTRKETYIKYLGKGLSISLSSFDTLSNDINKIMRTFKLDNNMISVCGDLRNGDILVKRKSMKEYFDFFIVEGDL